MIFSPLCTYRLSLIQVKHQNTKGCTVLFYNLSGFNHSQVSLNTYWMRFEKHWPIYQERVVTNDAWMYDTYVSKLKRSWIHKIYTHFMALNDLCVPICL